MTLLPPSYVPRRSRTIHSEILNDEICIYDWTTRRVHALNATAARVWKLCDGVTSVAQIANTLHADLSVAHVDDVVSLAVAEFSEAGLLEDPLPAKRLALSRRDIVKRLGLTAAMLPVVSSIAAPSALQAQSDNAQVFLFTGAAQTFVVPGGVTQIIVDAFGAAGGIGVGSRRLGAGGRPGRGGQVTGTIPVTAAETLTVYVGYIGRYSYVSPDPLYGFNGGGTGDGNGFDGGGGGGGGTRTGADPFYGGGGGGGSSYTDPAATFVTHGPGGLNGSGKVTISW